MRLLKDKKLVHRGTPVELHAGRYRNNRHSFMLSCPLKEEPEIQEQYAICTVNLPAHPCPSDEVYIKHWSENEGMVQWLVENGVVENHTTRLQVTGYVAAPRHKMTQAIIEELKQGEMFP